MSCTRKAAVHGSLERIKRLTHHCASTEIHREDDPALIDAVMGPSVWKHSAEFVANRMTSAAVPEFVSDQHFCRCGSRALFTLLARNLSQS